MQLLTSPAYDRLLTDDRNFHLVFLVVGGPFTLALFILSGFSWMRFRRAYRRSFPRRTYVCFAAVSLILGLLMTVVFVANVTSVVDPGQTLSGTTFSPLGAAWLQSGRAQLSPLLQHAIDERLAWQRPKAVICTVLLVAFGALTGFLWRALIRQSTSDEQLRKVSRLMLGAGVLSAGACLLLMVMVIGNAEGALHPLFLAVLYG